MRNLLFASLIALAAGGLPARAQAPADDPVRALDALYERRDLEGSREDRLARLETRIGDTSEFDVLWRLARHHCWIARVAQKEARVLRHAERCLELADRAGRIRPKAPDGYFWGAIAVGVRAQTRGVVSAFLSGAEGDFRRRLDAAVERDPTYEACSPLVAYGRFYFEAPWPKRDLRKARRYLERAQERCPKNARALLYLAELDLEEGRTGAGRAGLKRLVQGPVPGDPAEGRLVQREAREALSRLRDGR